MTSKYIEKTIDNRFNEIEQFYNKIKALMEDKKIKLYNHVDGIDKELDQSDSAICTEFFREIFEKDSMPNRIFKEILERESWVEEVLLIWYEEKISDKQIEKLLRKSITTLSPINGKSQFVIISDDKRWKKAKIYIF